MKLYHGSNIEIDRIDLSLSKPFKDFGRGFYLSDNEEQAWNMAHLKVLQTESGTEIVNVYEFNKELLTDGLFKVKHFDSYCEEWAQFILQNRSRQETNKKHDYDIVIGPIADDKVGVQIRLFNEKYIDVQTLLTRLKFIKGMTTQYFFGTECAIQTLKKL